MNNRLSIGVIAVVLAALVAITYAGVTDLGLVYDDHRLVENNPGLDGSVGSLFTRDLSGHGGWDLYRPLVALSWKLERGNVPLHHMVNVVWHVLAVWCVLGLGLVLGGGRGRIVFAAGAAAALFALHPLATEPVCWVSRRADVMAGAFTLASALACAHAVRGAGWGVPMAGLLAVGAMLSKEIGVIAPVMWIVAALALGAPRRWLARSAIAAAILIGGFAALRVALFGSVSGQPVAFVQNWVFDAPGAHPLATAFGLVAHGARLFVFPTALSADYSWRTFDPATWSPVVPIAGALVGIGLLAAIALGRRRPAVVVGVALALLAYVPVSNTVVPVGAAFGERFLYLPLAGIALAISAALTRVHVSASIGVVVLALIGGALSRARVPDWTTDGALFASVLDAYPENVVAHTYQAIALREAGDLAAASAHYTAALDVYPDYHLARVNRAFISLEIGEVEEAIAEARWIIDREPEPGAPYLVIGIGSLALGNVGNGEELLWRAAADPAIRRDALSRLFEFYRSRGDEEGLQRVRAAAAETPR